MQSLNRLPDLVGLVSGGGRRWNPWAWTPSRGRTRAACAGGDRARSTLPRHRPIAPGDDGSFPRRLRSFRRVVARIGARCRVGEQQPGELAGSCASGRSPGGIPRSHLVRDRLWRTRRAILLLAALLLGGCGSHRATVADCLNAQGFLVREQSTVVRGSSPGGVNFTLTVYPRAGAARRAYERTSPVTSVLVGDAVVDFAGNPAATPGGVPGRLSKSALARIRRCLARP